MNLIYFAKPFKTIKKSIDQVLNNDFFFIVDRFSFVLKKLKSESNERLFKISIAIYNNLTSTF